MIPTPPKGNLQKPFARHRIAGADSAGVKVLASNGKFGTLLRHPEKPKAQPKRQGSSVMEFLPSLFLLYTSHYNNKRLKL